MYGSGELVQTLLTNDLVDELWLKIFPIAGGAIPTAFTLTDYKPSPLGVIIASYKRPGEVETGSF